MTDEQQALLRFRAAHAGDVRPFAQVAETPSENFGVAITRFARHGQVTKLAIQCLMGDDDRPRTWRGTRLAAEELASRMQRLAERGGRKDVAYNVVEIISEGGGL
jgi:hypothetical protein